MYPIEKRALSRLGIPSLDIVGAQGIHNSEWNVHSLTFSPRNLEKVEAKTDSSIKHFSTCGVYHIPHK